MAAIGGLIPGSTNRIDSPAHKVAPPVFLVFTPIHADFAIPLTPKIREQFGFLAEAGFHLQSEDLKYLIIGWGSRAFYTSAKSYIDIGIGPTWTAITGDSSVMHVQPAGTFVEGDGNIRLDMPLENFDNLISFILNSFDRNSGKVQRISGAGFGLGDVFYEAHGQFNILESCNVWVARGLRATGFATGLWTPTTFSLKIGHTLFN
ncbi:MAG: TIGR02117 family protein [Fimbriimonadaceae bacterium]|nr:TIGR02117 family protein [Alphaproteobacteria bacterium]